MGVAPFRIAHDRIPTFRWDYRWMPYPGGVNTRHPQDHSVMTYVEWVMLSVAHVHFRPYPEMFGGILGSLESVLPPGFS